MQNYLFISDAAKEVKVESHVLRYWEEELHLPIKRNELGHRYYTEEDVERFKQIKGMKERGLQLKAIKMILKDGKLDVLSPAGMQEDGAGMGGGKEASVRTEARDAEYDPVENGVAGSQAMEGRTVEEWNTEGRLKEGRNEGRSMEGRAVESRTGKRCFAEGKGGDGLQGIREQGEEAPARLSIDIIETRQRQVESRADKSRRLQWLLQQLIRETLQENNGELCREIKESVVKELDYQFRMQEEREEARDKMLAQRDEEHFKKMDELLRKKARKPLRLGGKKKKGTS